MFESPKRHHHLVRQSAQMVEKFNKIIYFRHWKATSVRSHPPIFWRIWGPPWGPLQITKMKGPQIAHTDIALRNAKPMAKPYKLTDEKGLYLIVTPSGGRLIKLKFRN